MEDFGAMIRSTCELRGSPKTMLEFVPAQPQDLPLLFAMNKGLIDEYEDLSEIDYDRVLAWVRKNLEKNLPYFRRICLNGAVAGFFCLKDGEVDSLFLLPKFQRMGLGTQVIRHCQSLCPTLLLYVFRKNAKAISLYERMGFRITKEVSKTRYIMEWKNQNL